MLFASDQLRYWRCLCIAGWLAAWYEDMRWTNIGVVRLNGLGMEVGLYNNRLLVRCMHPFYDCMYPEFCLQYLSYMFNSIQRASSCGNRRILDQMLEQPVKVISRLLGIPSLLW